MKPKNLIGLWLAASQRMTQAYQLWAAQGGMAASLNGRRGPTRLADAAHERAEQLKADADWYFELSKLYPLGYSARWNRRAVS